MRASTRKKRTKNVSFTEKKPEDIPRAESDQEAEKQILLQAAAATVDTLEPVSHRPASSADIVQSPRNPPAQSDHTRVVAPPSTPEPLESEQSQLENISVPALNEDEIAVLEGWKKSLEDVRAKLYKDRELPWAFRIEPDHDAEDGPVWSPSSSVFPILPKRGPTVLEMGDEATKNLFHDVGDLVPPELRGFLPKDGTGGFKVSHVLSAETKALKQGLNGEANQGCQKRRRNSGQHERPGPAGPQHGSLDVTQGRPQEDQRPSQQYKMADVKIDLGRDLAQFEVIRGLAPAEEYFKVKVGSLKKLMMLWVEEYIGSYDDGSTDIFSNQQQKTWDNNNQLGRDRFSDKFAEFVERIAGKSNDWLPLIEHPQTRMYLVLALLSAVLEEYVFQPILFGATEEQEKALFHLGAQLKGASNKHLQEWLSKTIKTMCPTTSSIPHFAHAIDTLTTLFKDMITPLSPTFALDQQPCFSTRLHKIFQTAAQLSYEIRDEPSAHYRLISLSPGTPHDSEKMISRYETPVSSARNKPLLVRFPLFPALVRYRDDGSLWGEGPGEGEDEYRVLLKPEVVVFRGVWSMGVDEQTQTDRMGSESESEMQSEGSSYNGDMDGESLRVCRVM